MNAASHSWDPGFSSLALSTLIDKLPDGVVLTDSQGVIIRWNAAAVDITEIPVAAALDGFLWDVLHTLTPETTRSPQALDHLRTRLLAILQDEPDMPTITEMRLIQRADGASRTVQLTCFPLAAHGANHITCTLRDVTRDVALLNRLSTVERAVEQSPTSILITDPEGCIEYANPKLLDLTGYSSDELTGKTPRVFQSGLTPASTYQDLWNTIKGGRVWHGELHNRKKDGTLFWEEISISPVFAPDGGIQHFVAIKEDITSRKQAEQALSESAELFRTTFEQAAVGIAHVAPDGRFLRINQRFCNLIGYPCDAMLTMSFQEITHPDDLDTDLGQVSRMLAGEIKTYTLEKRYIRSDGTNLWVQLTVSLTTKPDGTPNYFISVVQDISKRKAALEALQQSEHRLRRSQAVAHVGDWTWDTRSNTVQWSDEMYRIFGVDQAAFSGDLNAVIDTAIHPEDRQRVYAANQSVIDQRQPAAAEYRVIWPDGSIHYLWAQPGEYELDEHGQIVVLSGIVQDISERKLAEMRLYESERFAHSTVDALSAEIAILDEAGVILTVNRAWREFARANSSDTAVLCEGVNYLAVIDRVAPGSRDAETAGEFRAGLLAVMGGERDSFSLEYPCHSPTEQRWFIAQITRFSGDGPLRVVIAHENITRRKLAELATLEANRELDHLHKAVLDQNLQLERTVNERTAQLRTLNHRMSTILDNIGDAILLLDMDNRIESANPAFYRLFGQSPDEITGHSVLDICVPQDSTALAKTLRSVSINGGTHRVQLTAGNKEDHAFDADFALTQVRDNTGHVVCSVRDITHLKEVERVKDQFVSMITHELRTPIASIVLGVDTLQKYFDRLNDEQKLDKLLALRRQTDTLTELVNSVLDTARFNARRIQSTSEIIDLTQTLMNVVADLKPQAESRQQTIELLSPDEALSFTGDYTDFTRIWANLLTNAIKYAGNKQVIMAGIWRCDDPTLPSLPELPFNAAEGGYLVGLVSDSGPGIRKQDMERLFSRFFRGWAAETSIPGTGLGLSLVKDILRVYGGDIGVRSEPDSGATFYFWLPAERSLYR